MEKENTTATGVQIWDKGTCLGVAEIKDGKWKFTGSELSPGEHIFRAVVSTIQSSPRTVNIEAAVDLKAPHFRNADSIAPGAEAINYYNHQTDGVVEIPDYGMQPGDTVRVSWKGRNITYHSEIQTVADPPTRLAFKISKYEVIDCINNSAVISYTLKRPPDPNTRESSALRLKVDGHDFDLGPLTISSHHDNLRAYKQEQFNSSSTARVRGVGTTTWESESVPFNQDEYLNFLIDPSWIEVNKEKPVIFNWSLRLNKGDTDIYFSQILRVGEL